MPSDSNDYILGLYLFVNFFIVIGSFENKYVILRFFVVFFYILKP